MKVYNAYYLLVLLILTACQSSDSSIVKLEILNEHLYYNPSAQDGKRANLEYYSTKERDSATNILMYKLTNLTGKKLLFLLSESDFENSLRKENPFVKITIKGQDEKLRIVSEPSAISFTSLAGECSPCYAYSDSIIKVRYKLRGISPEKIHLQELYKNA